MMQVEFEAKKTALVLLAIALCLTLASIAGQTLLYYFGPTKLIRQLDRLFNVDFEANIPAFFSALLLLLSAALLSLIALARKRDRIFCTGWASPQFSSSFHSTRSRRFTNRSSTRCALCSIPIPATCATRG